MNEAKKFLDGPTFYRRLFLRALVSREFGETRRVALEDGTKRIHAYRLQDGAFMAAAPDNAATHALLAILVGRMPKSELQTFLPRAACFAIARFQPKASR
jgi:hypothetical protein